MDLYLIFVRENNFTEREHVPKRSHHTISDNSWTEGPQKWSKYSTPPIIHKHTHLPQFSLGAHYSRFQTLEPLVRNT